MTKRTQKAVQTPRTPRQPLTKDATSTAHRILIWLRSLPSREPGERGYIAEMEELSGLCQEECSRAAAGTARAWTVRRLDQVAQHRGTTVPELLREIYDVSEAKVVPAREFRLPDEATQEYLETMRRVTRRSPRQLQEAVLLLRYLPRSGLGLLAQDTVRALLANGPDRALGEIAQAFEQHLKSEPAAWTRKRQRVMKEFRALLEALHGKG